MKWCFLLFFFSQLAYAASHHPQEFLKKISGKSDEGAQIVKHFCATCHAEKPQIPLGAPRQGNKEDWRLRLTQGIGVLFQHTAEGLNNMPPRGGCFECSDQQLLLAIIELLPPTAKKSLKNKQNTKQINN